MPYERRAQQSWKKSAFIHNQNCSVFRHASVAFEISFFNKDFQLLEMDVSSIFLIYVPSYNKPTAGKKSGCKQSIAKSGQDFFTSSIGLKMLLDIC